jgi:hypothetical protein
MYGSDIFSEPTSDSDTLANLGPLAPMAGTWVGTKGDDIHQVAEGSLEEHYVEHYDLQPIDPQTNGPQLFYGLRYHTHIVKPGEVETFHDQVGYWLWEPSTQIVTFTLAIPRGQVLLAAGAAMPASKEFEVASAVGSDVYGILSNPFLDASFRTLSYRLQITIEGDDSWSYDSEAVLQVAGRNEPFLHIDRNWLSRTNPPNLNPLAAPGT